MDRNGPNNPYEYGLALALYAAVLEQNMSAIMYLLRSLHANPNIILVEYGLAPLHLAVGIGPEEFSFSVVKAFLDHGGNPNIRSDDKITPLMIAAIWGRNRILRALLTKGGNPFLCDFDGNNSFDFALQNEHYSTWLALQYHVLLMDEVHIVTRNPSLKFYGLPCSQKPTPMLSSVDSYVPGCNGWHGIKKTEDQDPKTIVPARDLRLIQNFSNLTMDSNESDWFSDIESVSNFAEIYVSPLHVSERSSSNYVLPNAVFLNAPFTVRRSISDSSLLASGAAKNDKVIRPCGGSNSSSDSWNSCQKSILGASLDSISTVSTCATNELKTQLKEHNLHYGPVVPSTKRVYSKLLKRFKNGLTAPISPTHCVSDVLNSTINPKLESVMENWIILEKKLIADFSTDKKSQKMFFTYILADPFVTAGLIDDIKSKQLFDSWSIFLSSIFYIGKGKSSRPYAHLYESLNQKLPKSNCRKVQRIRNIWSQGRGVICIQAFHNICSLEAQTREAAMIDAMSLRALTNAQRGCYHGSTSNWSLKVKCQLGSILLFKVFKIYLTEGEREIKPKDIGYSFR